MPLLAPALSVRAHVDESGSHVLAQNGAVVAEVRTFDDEFTAWLHFSFVRGRSFRHHELLILHETGDKAGRVRLVARLEDDFTSSIPQLSAWERSGQADSMKYGIVNHDRLHRWRQQTRLYELAYAMPAEKKLEELPRSTLREYIRRFIRFKSVTDPRTRKQIGPVPVLSPRDANQVAGDIITIADFYELPLDLFLGIGAMENNYMNVRGDLTNTRWKRRPAKDDIVLERRRGRVLVLNDSAGVWQITRETLRYAHRLYLKDKRDYSTLPEHLRPPQELDVNYVDPVVLTTYAGLLLRDLIDYFDGDVAKAVGAYNGGPGNPNARYEEGVRTVAAYARNVLERAAELHGNSISEVKLLMPRDQ
jgi:hypothetical protein